MTAHALTAACVPHRMPPVGLDLGSISLEGRPNRPPGPTQAASSKPGLHRPPSKAPT
eukprot:CAMPEP_0176295390 /NCGR_PEP_ID=MMETSP0121_2-20121125/57643_1 /TAXON_ID=160619 /ORGANISM="Kryptoperidinium foliaceum, Strain CCMP 1326" /LENGTH=56 /DNA_ID=CAMNT_0017636469 /DNA_START=151 /DNA_END=318 /DNA_ORIENTATION=+